MCASLDQDSEPIEYNVVVDNEIFLASPNVAKTELNKNRIFIQSKSDSLSRKKIMRLPFFQCLLSIPFQVFQTQIRPYEKDWLDSEEMYP